MFSSFFKSRNHWKKNLQMAFTKPSKNNVEKGLKLVIPNYSISNYSIARIDFLKDSCYPGTRIQTFAQIVMLKRCICCNICLKDLIKYAHFFLILNGHHFSTFLNNWIEFSFESFILRIWIHLSCEIKILQVLENAQIARQLNQLHNFK